MNDIQPKTEQNGNFARDCSGYFCKAADLLPLADRVGDGCQAVAESHADKLDCSRRMRTPIAEAAKSAGDIFQALRDSLGGFFLGLGKRLESRGVRIGGHKVGDVITYRPIGQRYSHTSRIVAISQDFLGFTAILANGDHVNETHILKRGEIK
jgi:hypothetical protein